MIDLLKMIGSALITAFVTIYALHKNRTWAKQDKTEEKKDQMEEKIDKMAEQLSALTEKVDKLSKDFDKEVADSAHANSYLQAGLREILYDRIKSLCKKYIADGKLREEEYKSLKRMWEVYHEKLGGNGYLNGEMDEIEKLEKY